MKKYILLNLAALFALFLAACMFISCGKSKKSKPSEEGRHQPKPSLFANPFTDNPLSRAKAKANRMKCASNVGQITKTFLGFSLDWDGLFPWELPDREKEVLFGDADPKHLGTIFAVPDVKEYYGHMTTLLSPCDPERKKPNTKAQAAFESYDARKGKPVPHGAISYGICLGADGYSPETILCLTRNVSGDDLKGAKFLGNVMSGLKAHQGQMSTSDGSVMQVGDPEDLAESITVHTKAKGGNAPGPPSTKLMLPK